MRPDVYRRPAKPALLARQDRRGREIEKGAAPAAPAFPVAVDAATECHITPPEVAATMAAALGEAIGGPILEPSAGTGALIAAALAAGARASDILAGELHAGLAGALRERFPHVAVRQADWLEWYWTAPDQYRRGAILMNPPFSRVAAHVARARELLLPGGVLVALVPATFDDTGAEILARLGPDTFAAARVHSKIIRRVAP